MNQTIFIIILKHGKAQINVASGSEGVYKYQGIFLGVITIAML